MSEKFRAFYDKQLALLADKDHERLVREQYTPDAKLVNINDGVVVEGTDALTAHFKSYLEHLGYIKVLSTDKYLEADDSVMFEATAETGGGVARVYDTFVFRDGRISHHFSGLLGFTPKGS